MKNEIQRTVRDHGLEWEVWIESADSFNDLAKSLRKRGYRNVSSATTPIHCPPIETLVSKERRPPVEPEVKPQKGGMARRGSQNN